MEALLSAAAGTAPALETIRLFLHVLAATVWVGGQIVVLGLLPTARRLGGEAPRSLARAFAKLSWPAFALLVATGFWNLSTFDLAHQSTGWKTVLAVKLALVLGAGVAAFLHQRSRSRVALAIWGSVAGTCSLAALLFGVLLAGP